MCIHTPLISSSVLLVSVATFLYNMYVQVLGLIQDMPVAMCSLTGNHTFDDSLCHQWLDQECKYLDTKQNQSEIDMLKGSYVALLTKMELAK